MAYMMHWERPHPRTHNRIIRAIGAAVRAVTSEHTRALQAATKATSPRQRLAEVRAMYVPVPVTEEDLPVWVER